MRLGADMRRQVYLIFKEAVNNIVRHSQCTRAEIELKTERAWLALTVADNGKGFDPARSGDGNGLVSMRRRAAALGGEIVVSSRNGGGTTLMLKVPHKRRLWARDGDKKRSGSGLSSK
ncbi:MAG TPA: ATP-binding protein [Blastocatellia bacterium]|nr:ATP-binding protein [Blastocatellia bacterium]